VRIEEYLSNCLFYLRNTDLSIISLQLIVCAVLTISFISDTYQALISTNDTEVDWKHQKCVKDRNTLTKIDFDSTKESLANPRLALLTNT
jgi:hypothetical protein